jgi:hypothetical protein
MKTTFLILACLVFMAASALGDGDEEDLQISSRALPSDLTNEEQVCVIKQCFGRNLWNFAILCFKYKIFL